MRRLLRLLFYQYPRVSLTAFLLLAIAYWNCLPDPLFKDPTSLVLEARDGQLLSARIASDGQWRFPRRDSLPERFVRALVEFEDRRFFRHPGIDPIGLARALRQNWDEGRIVSGGSTLSMQVIRLARKGKRRSLWQKVIEMVLASRLELTHSKSDILALYAAHAPFGGNVVGLDAAAWRYYAKSPQLLSWGEAATLAVLPNSPALIHPGRNRDALLAKRNRLLDRLVQSGTIDAITAELGRAEPLPERPHPLPNEAPHLLNRAKTEYFRNQAKANSRLRSTLDHALQRNVAAILQRHQLHLRANGIHNLAAVVIEVESGDVRAYLGNVPGIGAAYQEAVDVLKAPRSTGSILKPFLYTMSMQDGFILPRSLLSDVPTQFNGYRPENYHRSYDGMVSARRAIIRSLNVPMVQLLQDYGLERFHFGLNKWGFSSIRRSPQHYGLPLILGGAEASLWEVTNTYVNLARSLLHYPIYNSRYDARDFRPPNYQHGRSVAASPAEQRTDEAPYAAAGAIWHCLEAMQEVQRPDSEGNWEQFGAQQRIAWKTGTSFGFRDAWAVGVTPRYAVGVWAGNADGEGRPGLVGVRAAAPVLFEVFDLLRTGDWFEMPYDDLVRIPVCRQSGYRAGALCAADSVWVPAAGLKVRACPHHQLVHLDAGGQWRVNGDCENPGRMRQEAWFVLPPVAEHYYKNKQPHYRPLPPYRADCNPVEPSAPPMQLIYPQAGAEIYLPIDLDGRVSKTVFKAAHRDPTTTIHWHLDETYLGSTEQFHHLELRAEEGPHRLTLVDEVGHRVQLPFKILAQ
ncbi:MAG: penicillin-binding protein 1C [Bacteroidota bacterium]